ncbi:MAG: hypothetical protein WA373_04935 [Burkholderiales bacterium]
MEDVDIGMNLRGADPGCRNSGVFSDDPHQQRASSRESGGTDA